MSAVLDGHYVRVAQWVAEQLGVTEEQLPALVQSGALPAPVGVDMEGRSLFDGLPVYDAIQKIRRGRKQQAMREALVGWCLT